MIKYIHIRERGNLYGSPHNHGGFTVAYETTQEDPIIEWNYAVCNDQENFCKYTGRTKALGRLLSTKLHNFYYNRNDDRYNSFYDFLNHMSSKDLRKRYPLREVSSNYF